MLSLPSLTNVCWTKNLLDKSLRQTSSQSQNFINFVQLKRVFFPMNFCQKLCLGVIYVFKLFWTEMFFQGILAEMSV